jgi:3-hydroxyisobutyrate dehydrogenase-like beta-hydroxyacid dehydrogenase
MTKLAVCGLGLLGRPIATRLVETGNQVVVWNRTSERAGPVVEAGATQAFTPAEAAAGADVAITVLSTPEALEEVVFGRGGLAEGLAEGSMLVDMSTVGPDAVRSIGERLPRGVELMDAPVLGSIPQATEGTLKVFAGGPPEAYRRMRPVFEALGTPLHVGPLGSGAAMKLVVNSTLGPVMAAIGEAMALSDSLGLDQGMVLDVLSGSAIGVSVKSKRARIESGTYEPNFKLDLALKDSSLITEAAHDRGVALRVATAVRDLLAMASEAGLGGLDYSALVAHLRGRPAASPSAG